jgi:hypothetical protein
MLNRKNTVFPLLCISVKICSVLREKHRLKAFDNRELRRKFGPRREEERGDWRKCQKHDFYSSSNIIRMTKSRTMRWARHVVRMGVKKKHAGF